MLLYGDLNSGIGIVALPDIKQTRNTANVTKVELVEAELTAGQREDRAIFRHRFGKVGVIITARLGAVASADQEKVFQSTTLDGIDYLRCDAQNGIVSETGQDGFFFFRFCKAVRRECSINHRRKVAIINVLNAGPLDKTAGKDACL